MRGASSPHGSCVRARARVARSVAKELQKGAELVGNLHQRSAVGGGPYLGNDGESRPLKMTYESMGLCGPALWWEQDRYSGR